MVAHLLTSPNYPYLDFSDFLREHCSCSLGVCVLLPTLALIITFVKSFSLRENEEMMYLDIGLVEGPEVLDVVLGLDHHQVNVAA